MTDEKITSRHAETGKTLEVVVFSKRAEAIEIVIGQGMSNMRCVLTPARNGLAYAGRMMGRELVYERSQSLVKADLEKLNPKLRGPRAR